MTTTRRDDGVTVSPATDGHSTPRRASSHAFTAAVLADTLCRKQALLRPPTGGSPKRSILEGARQCVLRFPRSSVRDKQNGGVENIILAVRRVETAIERGLRAGLLLLEEAFRIHPAIAVEGQHGKACCGPTHTGARPASSTTRSAMRTRCLAKFGNTGPCGSRSIRSNFAFVRRKRLLADCRYPRAVSEEPSLGPGSSPSDSPRSLFAPFRRWPPDLSTYSSASSGRSSSACLAPLTCAQKLDLRLCWARILASNSPGDSRCFGPV